MGELRWRLSELGELEDFWGWIRYTRLRQPSLQFDAERALVSFDIEFEQSDEAEVERRWLMVRLTRTPIVIYRIEVTPAVGLDPFGPDPDEGPHIVSVRADSEGVVFDCFDEVFRVRGRELVATAVRSEPTGWVEWRWRWCGFSWTRRA